MSLLLRIDTCRKPSTRANAKKIARGDSRVRWPQPTPDAKERSGSGKRAFESTRLGRSPWILHTIVHFSSLRNGSVINMAISSSDALDRERDSQKEQQRQQQRGGVTEAARAENWIPRSGRLFKPLLADDLYVTRILAARIDSEDEASVYFVAAPVANVSRRFLYKIKVVYPPLEYRTLEAATCLTCPEENDNNNWQLSNEGRPGQSPRCIWPEVRMSFTAENYILNCRGPMLPWTAIISARNNRIIRRLDTWSEFRAWQRSISQPPQREFELELGNGSRARVKLHVPYDWINESGGCRRKLKLLLRLADEQGGQMVDAKFDMSITTYLTGARGYAVIYADVRGSAFHGLELAGEQVQGTETAQIVDYERVARLVAGRFDCLDTRAGFGVFGQAYGGHVVLNLVAGKNEDGSAEGGSPFVCGAAIEPFAAWQAYVHPFTMKPPSELVASLRKKLFKRLYLSPLTLRLRGRDFALFARASKRRVRRHYEDNLLGLLARHAVEFEYRRYRDDCSSKLRLYQDLSTYFDRCFERQSRVRSL